MDVVPLPVAGVLLVMLLPVDFVLPLAGVPVVDPFPFVAGVEDGVGFVGSEVIGLGTSGIGLDKTFATSSVTFASVPVLFRYL